MKMIRYGIFKKFKNGKLQKEGLVGVTENYELAFPDINKKDYEIVGISGGDIYYFKTEAIKDCEELNKIWAYEAFVVKKIFMEIEE